MRYINTYKIFVEKLITDPNKMLSMNKERFLQSIELYHCGDHIWVIKVEDSYTRAMIFLRPQEFYESSFEEIINKQFRFSRFMDIYKLHYGKPEFTYGNDWAGFNIPSDILEDCMFNIPDDEINNYDKIMLSIISTIKNIEGDDKYYLLGVDELEEDVLQHEFAHAMYFTLPEYKIEMDKLTKRCDDSVKESMYKCITEYGYADHVLPDEMQAYMATGLGDKMEEMKIENIDRWCSEYKQIFDRYYSKCLYESPENIKINWTF